MSSLSTAVALQLSNILHPFTIPWSILIQAYNWWYYKTRGLVGGSQRGDSGEPASVNLLLGGTLSWCWTVTLTLSWIAHYFHGWVHTSILMWISKCVNGESSGPFLRMKIRVLDYQSHVMALSCRRLLYMISQHTTRMRRLWTLSSETLMHLDGGFSVFLGIARPLS